MSIVLYGAGTIGRLVARQLIDKGETPAAFADNDKAKWGTRVEGIVILAPEECRIHAPDASWVATVHRTPSRPQILKHIEEMGVKSVSLYDFIPARVDYPPDTAVGTIASLITHDPLSCSYFFDQLAFRKDPTCPQLPPLDIANVYFENFYIPIDDEHFVDCGAADGDTIRDFMSKWDKFERITAFEPDPQNQKKLIHSTWEETRVLRLHFAVSDHFHTENFSACGDQTSHLGKGNLTVNCAALDDIFKTSDNPPTLIKMDIEGSEMEALWGARKLLKDHSPVLAICAYHHGPDLWEIPLLIHALNPSYKLFFRRYLEATWELIWYAVPPDRII